MTPSPTEVAEMASVMHRHAIQRLVGDGFVLELHPSAFQAPGAELAPEVPKLGEEDRCHCGHENYAEHDGNTLCLRGCPMSLCQPETVKPKE